MNNPTIPTLDDPDNLSQKAARAWERTTEKDTAEDAGRVWDNTKGKAAEALQAGAFYVREHPGTSVLGVFGAGMLIGAFVACSVVHEQRNEAADSLHRFLTRLGRKLNLD